MNHEIRELPVLILYPHARCNCRCVMCDIWKTDEARELTPADLERHIADIERLNVKRVVFSGGEPLMHSDLFRLAGLLRSRGVRVTLLSTGLLMERFAARIADSIDDAIVSLDGPPPLHDRIRRVPRAFELLASGVRAVRRVRAAFPIAARCVVQRANHARLRDAVETAKSLGLDSISLLAADLTSTAFNRPEPWPEKRRDEVGLSSGEIAALEAEIEAIVESADPFVLETPAKLRRIVRHFKSYLGLERAEAPRCNAPWVSAVVEASGAVRPCFFHAPVGNIHDAALIDVLNGPAATAFRVSLDVANDATCRRCVCSLHLENVS